MFLTDELGIPLTLDGYTKQLRELQRIHFPEAKLLPGTLFLLTFKSNFTVTRCVQVMEIMEIYWNFKTILEILEI